MVKWEVWWDLFNPLLDGLAIADAKEEPLRRLYYKSGHDKWKSNRKSYVALDRLIYRVTFSFPSITEAFFQGHPFSRHQNPSHLVSETKRKRMSRWSGWSPILIVHMPIWQSKANCSDDRDILTPKSSNGEAYDIIALCIHIKYYNKC